MQIILLDKVENLGKVGEQVNVKPGYARNFLIPYNKAVLATKKNIEYFKVRHFELEAKLTEAIKSAKIKAQKITSLNFITIPSKSGKNGKLFGSIGRRDIADALNKVDIKVNKNEIRIQNGVLRTLGEHEVNFQFYNKITAKLVIKIVAN